MKNKCLVLLSTYNGEKYLKELIDSVLSQKNIAVDILIRDDGSTDNTIEILKLYKKQYGNIKYYCGKNIGYAKSFWDLVKKSEVYDYYAFCDQDDIWKEEKIYNAIRVIEKNALFNKRKPFLYTSNVIPVNNNKEILRKYTFKAKKVLNVFESFQKSILPGCTFVFNDAAKQIMNKYNGYMESHDWATYIIVNTFGKVIFDQNSYIFYRIHNNNTIGKKNSLIEVFNKAKRFFNKSKCTRSKFAKDFYDCYSRILPEEIKEWIKYLGYYKENIKYKCKIIISKKFRGIIFKLYILMNRI